MLGPLSPEKRRLQGELRPAIQYLKGGYKKERGRLFRKVCSDRSSGGGFNLKEGIFRLDIRKIFFFFTIKKVVVRHWIRLPREVVDAPSLETFKVRFDMALST